MRHRAVSAVRVYDRCARCGTTYLRNYDVRKVTAFIDGRRHELVVCAACDESHANTPTLEERDAMGIDLGNPIECMRYMQRHGADPARMLRTAAHFLSPNVFAVHYAVAQDEFAKRRAAIAKHDEERLAQVAATYNDPAPTPKSFDDDYYDEHGETNDDEDDDDL